MAYRHSRMFSISDGVIKSFAPTRMHKMGHYEKREGKDDEWVLDGVPSVVMLSDCFTYEVTHKGIGTGEFREKFVHPIKYAVCAWDEDAPPMSQNADRCYSGKVVEGDIDGERTP